MQNEHLDRDLMELLLRLTGGEPETLLDAFQSGTSLECYCEILDRAGESTPVSRRIMLREERLALPDGVEPLLIELQELGLLPPPVAEKLIDRFQESGTELVPREEAVSLASLILRTEFSEGLRGNHLMLEGLGSDMTAH